MEQWAPLRFVLLSGLIGFGVFSASYALHVWRRRRAAASGGSRFSARLSKGLRIVLVAGLLAMGLTVAVREVVRPAGMLEGDGLHAVRSRQEFRLATLCRTDAVEAGQTLARFEAPERLAEIEQLRLRLERLEAERAARKLQPLARDPELIRHYQNLVQDRRQLRASLDQLLPASSAIVRERIRERNVRQEEVAELDNKLEECRKEIEQAAAEEQQHRRTLERMRQLAKTRAIPTETVETQQTEAEVARTEVHKLHERFAALAKEKESVEGGLQNLDAVAAQQTEQFSEQIRKVQSELAELEAEEPRLAKMMQEDAERAKNLRQQEIEQFDLQIRECRVTLGGTQGTLVVSAPFAGRVLYRAPSPNSAQKNAPLLVVGAEQGCRLRLRLPRAQIASLRAAGTVKLELIEPKNERGLVTRHFVEHRFTGRFRHAQKLENDSGYALAVLDCLPPAEVLPLVANGEEQSARLMWKPPLLTILPFQGGLLAFLAGGVGLAVLRFTSGRGGAKQRERADDGREAGSGRGRRSPANGSSPTPGDAHFAGEPVEQVELGAVGTMLGLLADRFRLMLLSGRPDADLVATVEWALDRHQDRAARQLAHRFGDGPQLQAGVEKLVGEQRLNRSHNGNGNGNGRHRPDARTRDRLVRILRLLSPELLETQLANHADEARDIQAGADHADEYAAVN